MVGALPHMTEDEVEQAFKEECSGPKRLAFMIRLHQRLCSLRMQRERMELSALAEVP